jgi:hypothetical protein
MKNIWIFFSIVILIICCKNATNNNQSQKGTEEKIIQDTAELTNNFYDNTPTYKLPLNRIEITGEIENSGFIDLSKLSKRSLIVKETLLNSAGGNNFVGAYRYDGYSLFDILNGFVIKKKNAKEFSQIIDVYVEIENDKGEKAVFSWGEIFYPNNLHKIIIAGSVSRIVPSKAEDLWPIPTESKIVAANDLLTERNISNPVRINVVSYPRSFKVFKNLSPMYSKTIKIFDSYELKGEISVIPSDMKIDTISIIFYGRGKGIHSTLPFTGVLLKDLIKNNSILTKENIKNGIVCIVGKDGYRSVLSFSELFNRNDQQEFLIVPLEPYEDGGAFRLIAVSDFFSDRAIKSITEIHLSH